MRNSGNLLLDSCSESDAAALRPYLKPVHLDHQQVLFEGGEKVTEIHFPTGAMISLVLGLSSGEIVTNVEALQEIVCDCYEAVKSYYEALLGPQAAYR